MTHLPRQVVVAFSGPVYRIALNPRVPVRWQRRISEASVRINRVPRATIAEPIVLGTRPAERVTVGATERPRAVLYLHGGGYTIGSPRMYRALAAHLARSAGAVVFTLDYRLAPENPYPAGLDDAVAAFRVLVDEHGFTPSRIALAGDSAGGGLAVAAARVLTDAGRRPGALALLSPWVDPEDHDMPARDFVIDRDWGTVNAAAYRGDADPRDPGYAPLHGRLDGLPPTLIHCSDREILNAQIRRLADAATAAGVDVTLVEQQRLWHSAHLLAGTLREATDAVSELGAFLHAHLDAGPDYVPELTPVPLSPSGHLEPEWSSIGDHSTRN